MASLSVPLRLHSAALRVSHTGIACGPAQEPPLVPALLKLAKRREHRGRQTGAPRPELRAYGARCQATNMADTQAASSVMPTEWFQKTIELPPFRRGCHIITNHVRKAVPELAEFQVGIAHIFVLHTSASLTINENASPDVPLDMEDSLNKLAPEGPNYRHLDEGYDDMPAHVKASLMGSSLTVPVTAGRLHLGTWQGIWLNEHRNHGGARSLCITIQGQKRADGRSYK